MSTSSVPHAVRRALRGGKVEFLVCPECGFKVGDIETGRTSWGPVLRWFYFVDGITEGPDGTWYEHRRASQKREAGHHPRGRYRVRLLPPSPDLPNGVEMNYRGSPGEYPAKVACPRCHVVVLIDAAEHNIMLIDEDIRRVKSIPRRG